ncbi:MAG: sodium ion-translocating decarboxylase subunit beta [Deltaproteobacteria bacterium]|nr:sodium ion-translocating decarboxylase subunit beta [Deltaproteobacteria bacterium]
MGFSLLTIENILKIAVGAGLLWMGIKEEYEPLLLVPIGFGTILVNIPLAGMMEPDGRRHYVVRA